MQKTYTKQTDFANLYIAYYAKLLRFAKTYVVREEDAENIVQDVFMQLWDRWNYLDMVLNINAYLFHLIKNRCLDHLKHKLPVEKYHKSVIELESSLKMQALERFDDSILTNENIDIIIEQALDTLPEKCREIFTMSRINGMKYKEISEKLGISVNTVENQISIALKKLRFELKDYLPTLFLYFYSYLFGGNWY